MVNIILEGNRREVYAIGFDLMEARNERGERIFEDIREDAKKSTFREEDSLDSTGALVFQTDKYSR